MKLAEAIEAAKAGERLTSSSIPFNAVLKMARVVPERLPTLRVVFEKTGDGYDFTAREEHDISDWQVVTGWLNYGSK